ncbi:uncharacterized protein LOC134198629 [Corticium candelabrum]|uniref:uncharacterized protein LOC134198629 n=1 Tax=Corticium candelabrum TaxID=121492 RepID=UPI002E256575|nr:uncharacterized protein LOC134198629 [Corticium candelabrum]XP_062524022.1 uncharacterized protein LOC134198629 [Corticium candelabrum]
MMFNQRNSRYSTADYRMRSQLKEVSAEVLLLKTTLAEKNETIQCLKKTVNQQREELTLKDRLIASITKAWRRMRGKLETIDEQLVTDTHNSSWAKIHQSPVDRDVTLHEIRNIYLKICHCWKAVARNLGPISLADYEINGLRDSECDECCYQMLTLWQEKQRQHDRRASVFHLCSALIRVNLADAAQDVFGADVVRDVYQMM